MGLLILAFLILGVGGGKFPDAFGASRADSVITAGGHALSASDFKRVFDQQKQRLEEQNKQSLSTELLVQNNVDQSLLGQLGLDQAFAELLSRAGVAPGRTVVDDQIRKIMPGAFDKVTGKFSELQFKQLLAQQGLTPAAAEAQIADELAQRHFGTAMEAGFKLPRIFAAVTAVGALEYRDVSYFLLDARTVPQPMPPTDAQLSAFMQDHAAQLKRPEMRTIALVKFSAAALAPTVTVDPAAIQKEFDFRKDSLSVPEKRTLVEIPLKNSDQAAQAGARLAQGEDPAAVARSFGVDPINYTNTPQSAIADRKVAAEAFSLAKGQSRGPVQGDLGIAAIEVFSVTPGHAAVLADVKAKIEGDLRLKMAKDQAYKQSQAFDDARTAGSSIAQAAQKVGAPTVEVGPFTAGGVGTDGKPLAALSDKIAKAVFAAAAGEESDLQDAGSGEYFAFKVEKVTPSALPALADIRPQLMQAYMQQTFFAALKSKVEGLVARIKKGEPIDQVAASVGSHVQKQQGLQRLKAEQGGDPVYAALGKEFLEGAFTAKPGDAFPAGAQGGAYVARLDAVRPGDPVMTARLLEAVRGSVAQGYVRDLLSSSEQSAAETIKVTQNLSLARQAIGVDPNFGKPGAKVPPKAP